MITISSFAEGKVDCICALLSAKKNINQYKIDLVLDDFTLRFYQKERYDGRLVAEVIFDKGYTIFWDDVKSSIDGSLITKRKVNNIDVDEYNLRLIDEAYDFIKNNVPLLLESPPSWFPVAVKISTQRIYNHFPEVALLHEEDGLALWRSWGRR